MRKPLDHSHSWAAGPRKCGETRAVLAFPTVPLSDLVPPLENPVTKGSREAYGSLNNWKLGLPKNNLSDRSSSSNSRPVVLWYTHIYVKQYNNKDINCNPKLRAIKKYPYCRIIFNRKNNREAFFTKVEWTPRCNVQRIMQEAGQDIKDAIVWVGMSACTCIHTHTHLQMHEISYHWKDTYETIRKLPSKKRNWVTGDRVRMRLTVHRVNILNSEFWVITSYYLFKN